MKSGITAILFILGSTACYGISGKAGAFEYAIDAPWRIEPRLPSICSSLAPCPKTYRIPIQISIHDVNRQLDDLPNNPLGTWGIEDFVNVVVEERVNTDKYTRQYGINDLHEVEYTRKYWPFPVPDGYTPDHKLCRRWGGADCSEFRKLADTSEWHATLFYQPKFPTPARTVLLSVKVTLTRKAPYPTAQITLTDQLRVHLGEDALPRFGANWLYGDLHYHSQGTDNEGESAYSYRGVLQAMAAVGLDFLFATDHASNSEQITDFDPPLYYKSGLRDMSFERFAWAQAKLNASGGANHEVLSYPWDQLRLKIVPQIYPAGEVDTIPEFRDSLNDRVLRYGNGLSYDLNRLCTEKPSYVPGCASASELLDPVQGTPSLFRIRDIQGLGDKSYYARQHMIHLPEDPNRTDIFIPSLTSEFGGATKRLHDINEYHYDFRNKGVYFLAHPTSIADGSSEDRLGPDLLPFTDVQLEDAFRSEAFLGLQFWNEDTRLRNESIQETDNLSGFQEGAFEFRPWNGNIGQWEATAPSGLYRALHHGAYLWDKLLLWGLNPARTATLSWLPQGQPRRVFMAGGSDAHGDLNYRREGYANGTTAITDTAIGKPRNLVNASPDVPETLSTPRPVPQQTVVAGLRRGEFSVTDGPAVRIAIDKNRNGVIDLGDATMGAFTEVSADTTMPVLVEWKSTRDFGAVTRVDLYVGVSSDQAPEGAVFAPANHAVRSNDDPGSSITKTVTVGGVTFQKMSDGYWLRSDLTKSVNSMEGVAVFNLKPWDFTVIHRDPFNPVDLKGNPQRLYVRAFVSTSRSEPDDYGCNVNSTGCIPRFGYTNPVWARVLAPIVTR